MPRSHLLVPVRVLAAILLAACVVASAPADVVILKDGFVVQGTVRKEMVDVVDKASGQGVSVPKANGFDILDEGPKVMIFSTHFKQLGEIGKDVKIRPEYKGFNNPIPGRKSDHRMPAIGGAVNPPDFDAKWRRTLQVNVPGGFDRIEQQITYLDPYTCWIISPTHLWRVAYRTSEMDPAKVRKLLSTHPDLIEADGKPDAIKRVAIARFMKDAGWLQLAQDEVARIRKEVPAPLPKESQAEFDKLLKEMDVAIGEMVATEAELALNAGRYQYAAEVLAVFPQKTADPKDVLKVTQVTAQLKTAQERYDKGRQLLRSLIDEVTGDAAVRRAVAVGGGPIAVVWPAKQPAANTQLLRLAEAAEQVYRELHQDSSARLEFFVSLADQAQRERAAGREPSKKPEELLATAVSGWAKGKNGATPVPGMALRVWDAREAILAHQRATTRNARLAILDRYRKNNPIPLDEMVQIISLLPPVEPENLSARTGTLLPEGDGTPPGTYRRKSAGTPNHPTGLDYLIKLPPEYHHGRAYPVLIALPHPGMDSAVMTQALARETERQGYILVVPEWTGQFANKPWEYRGEDHDWVTGVLRDVVRHFTVDNDRVFLFGIGEGANMALDVGMSHPDLFAGVIPMGPMAPKWQGMFIHYWPNAQKLPVYVVTGEQAPAFQNLRFIFERWMPKGYPSLMAVYKGRGIEWYGAETPVLFDWMARKRRPNPASVLRGVSGTPMERWQVMRPDDNHFFWLSVDRVSPTKLLDSGNPNLVPASVSGDVRGNLIDVNCSGARTVTIWLSADMINWQQPVRVTLNGAAPNVPAPWRPKVLTPDMEVLLEDYHQRGDRRMLFIGKLEFENRN